MRCLLIKWRSEGKFNSLVLVVNEQAAQAARPKKQQTTIEERHSIRVFTQ